MTRYGLCDQKKQPMGCFFFVSSDVIEHNLIRANRTGV
jgi:hypothetical protein